MVISIASMYCKVDFTFFDYHRNDELIRNIGAKEEELKELKEQAGRYCIIYY